jgi:hypothetical protein
MSSATVLAGALMERSANATKDRCAKLPPFDRREYRDASVLADALRRALGTQGGLPMTDRIRD